MKIATYMLNKGGVKVNNEKLRDFAVELLYESDIDQVEAIEIREDSYSNGEPYLEITVDYHLKGGEE